MKLDLVDLRLFVRIVESGSITRGATAAHMTLASASARLRSMEVSLGTQLLIRHARGVLPTAAGDALVHHARQVLTQMQRLRGELVEFGHGLSGRIRLLANTAAFSEHLVEPLARFLLAHPNVDIDLRERGSREIVRAISGGLADIGVASNAFDDVRVQRFEFAVDRLVAVLPFDHPLARDGSPLDFVDLLSHRFVGLGGDSALQGHLDEHARGAGRSIRYRVRMRSLDAVCRLVAAGAGVAVVPKVAIPGADMRLAWRPLRDPWALRRLSLCVQAEGAQAASARALLAHLRDAARATG